MGNTDARAVPKNCLYLIRQVTDGQHEILDSGVLEPFYLPLDDGLAGDGEEGLGGGISQGPEPRAQAPGQNNCFHRVIGVSERPWRLSSRVTLSPLHTAS